ncbi:MAG TPA: cation:proton antiporter [Polyangiaceae bacterium]|nr:cation:proton antiporter [Polyangiaceae bacterium]
METRGTTTTSPARGLWAKAAYLGMLAAAVGLFLLVRAYGEGLTAPLPAAGPGAGPAAVIHLKMDTLLHVLLSLVAVIVTARALGALFRRMHQPPVIGEVVAGLLLGPSLLGRVAPEATAYLMPPQVAPYLGVISQIGAILYMFLVGLELDLPSLRNKGHATVAISHASIVVPFSLGALLALPLYPRLSSADVPFTVFALFLGVAMSVTAFPVLARILAERQMSRTKLGVIALTCAAADDVTAWCLLAFVVAVAQARLASAWLTAGLTLGYLALMLAVVRPLVARRLSRVAPGQDAVAAVFVALLLSALATEYIGIHAIFGAFLLGAVIPHDSPLARHVGERLVDLVTVLLLPAFFAFTGMRTRVGLVSGAEQWALCGAITLVASLGKFGGSSVAARLAGLDWRDAASIGILMNTRGLMELVVLNIGFDLGVISPSLFAMLVLMALATTAATTPVLQLLQRRRDPALAGEGVGSV